MSKYEMIAEEVTKRIFQEDPTLIERYGERGRNQTFIDNMHHLDYLKTAMELNTSKIFTDYALWLRGILIKHGMTTQTLIDNFLFLEEELEKCMMVESEIRSAYIGLLGEAVSILRDVQGGEAQ
ncbi:MULTISPECIES: hypothetical protein [Cytobacillus]|uniref:hypothetical protein n=1 Tax=Cytobacillus TaxID=2675230 RepID=UPI0025A269C7|nr:hypothetical protein [Cytobacillus kochii]MDM5206434.1 hypothetical protein [Cytobacillus kochii]